MSQTHLTSSLSSKQIFSTYVGFCLKLSLGIGLILLMIPLTMITNGYFDDSFTLYSKTLFASLAIIWTIPFFPFVTFCIHHKIGLRRVIPEFTSWASYVIYIRQNTENIHNTTPCIKIADILQNEIDKRKAQNDEKLVLDNPSKYIESTDIGKQNFLARQIIKLLKSNSDLEDRVKELEYSKSDCESKF